MSTPNYPSTLPLDSIKEVIRIVQVGNSVPEKAGLAKNLWIVQGYAQKSLLGDPDVPSGLTGLHIQSLGQPLPASLPELTAVLQQIVDHSEGTDEFAPQALPMPPAWLIKLVLDQLAALLLSYLGA